MNFEPIDDAARQAFIATHAAAEGVTPTAHGMDKDGVRYVALPVDADWQMLPETDLAAIAVALVAQHVSLIDMPLWLKDDPAFQDAVRSAMLG